MQLATIKLLLCNLSLSFPGSTDESLKRNIAGQDATNSALKLLEEKLIMKQDKMHTLEIQLTEMNGKLTLSARENKALKESLKAHEVSA